QSPFRRSDALAGGHPDDQGDHRYRHSARHLRARPYHRRQEWTCKLEGIEVDLASKGKPCGGACCACYNSMIVEAFTSKNPHDSSCPPVEIDPAPDTERENSMANSSSSNQSLV